MAHVTAEYKKLSIKHNFTLSVNLLRIQIFHFHEIIDNIQTLKSSIGSLHPLALNGFKHFLPVVVQILEKEIENYQLLSAGTLGFWIMFFSQAIKETAFSFWLDG